MPLIRKWKRTPLVWQLAVLLSVALVVIGALVIAVIALGTARPAAREAKNAVDCVNTTLGKRNDPATKDAKAHIAFAKAVDALFEPTAPADRAKKLAEFQKATDLYRQTLQEDQQYRDAHPLGRCE